MPFELSKDEVVSLVQAYANSAVALEKLVMKIEEQNKIQTVILEKQDKFLEKLTNGITSDIRFLKDNSITTSNIKGAVEDIISICIKPQTDDILNGVEEKLNNSSIAIDAKHTKWFVGIVSLVAAVVMVVINIVNWGGINKEVEADAQSSLIVTSIKHE